MYSKRSPPTVPAGIEAPNISMPGICGMAPSTGMRRSRRYSSIFGTASLDIGYELNPLTLIFNRLADFYLTDWPGLLVFPPLSTGKKSTTHRVDVPFCSNADRIESPAVAG